MAGKTLNASKVHSTSPGAIIGSVVWPAWATVDRNVGWPAQLLSIERTTCLASFDLRSQQARSSCMDEN